MTLSQARQQPPATALQRAGSVRRALVMPSLPYTANAADVVAVNVLTALAGINHSSSTQSVSVAADPAGYRSVVGSHPATASNIMVSRLAAGR